MKIIKEGSWEKKITCRGCKTVMKIIAEDIRYGLYSTEYEQEFEGQFYVDCPVCTKKIVQKDIPESIQEEARTERKD